MVQSAPHQQIGYLLRSYPRLSQTFVLNEILAVERLGVDIQIFAIINPKEPIVQEQAEEVKAPVQYLDEAGKRNKSTILREHFAWVIHSPGRYFRTLWYVLQNREVDTGYTASTRYQCFLQAVYLASILRDDLDCTGYRIGHLHAHFAHDPAFIALLVHMLTGLSFSFTAHARDLYQIPASCLSDRVSQASGVVTCCRANVEYLEQALPDRLHGKVHLVHHGVDLQGFNAARPGEQSKVPLILSVGRLVEKKGFHELIQACRHLRDGGHSFRCEIYGEGPLRGDLNAFIHQNGLADRVVLAGARLQKELVPVYQAAEIFALTPFVTENGDRDGIPNVILEAMACGLPVVSTAVAGIPEIVIHNLNGLLCPPGDPQSIAKCLAELLDDCEKRRQLGVAARRSVVEGFDARRTARQLAVLFENALETEPIFAGG